jgi:2-polyprenyl-3-methyl-5-hydroxy-6-metoxy-1,4-benzoquinol methylase
MAADTRFHHRIPIVGRPFVQRNEARLQRDQARRELMRVGAERDEVRRERDEALDNLARHKLDTSILDTYVNEAPSHQAAFRVFEGEWSSNVPGYGCGTAAVFDDNRIKFFAEQCGGFQGKRVLELGPLEGGHTSMIANAGAANITAIESNTRAFLKCLIVQNALKFKANFMLGDFGRYLQQCDEKFDVLIASGVLYHMSEPVRLLENAAKVTNRIGLWTHYYDPEIINDREDLRRRFESSPRIENVGQHQIELYQQSYLDALQLKGFCGGSAPTSYWLTRDSLLAVLEELGFNCVIHEDSKTHPNGPSMTLFAARRGY